jgi:putative DNA primase/helicase
MTDDELAKTRQRFLDAQKKAQGATAVAENPSLHDDELHRLATLSPIEYGLERAGAAERMHVPVRFLDAEVEARKRDAFPKSEGSGQRLVLPEIEPADDPVDGAALLSNLTAKLSAHVILPPHAALAISLWIIRAHADDCFDTSPLLGLSSPEKRCGKTTVLEMIETLVPRPLVASNVAPAVLFRAIELARPTLLIDEMDTFTDGNEELRGILNSGHRRGAARVIRCVGDDHEPRSFSTWCPKVVAMIGKFPDTIADRTISSPMRRKAPGEKVQRISWTGRKGQALRAHMHILARGCARWAQDHSGILRDAEPVVPESLNDRQRDNWTPLLAIAEVVGGEWTDRARKAAVALSGGEENDSSSAGVRLLADVRELFKTKECDRLGSQQLCDALAELEERPWSAWRHGKPISPHQLAKVLKPFGVESRTIREAGTTQKGYHLDLFADAFDRYLTPLDIPSDLENPVSKGNTVTTRSQSGDNPLFEKVTGPSCDVSKNGTNPAPMADCDGVTFQNPIFLADEHISEDDAC